MVDDDEEEFDLLEDTMGELGQTLHHVQNGEEALKFLKQCTQLPCLILLDLNMPKLNGSETLIHLKSNPRYKDIVVIIYSTSINNLEKEKCMALGAYSYLVKPISYAETLTTAKYLLQCVQLTKSKK